MAPELYADYRRTCLLAQVSIERTAVEKRDLTSLYRASNCSYNRLEADVAQLVEQSIRNRIYRSFFGLNTSIFNYLATPSVLPYGVLFGLVPSC